MSNWLQLPDEATWVDATLGAFIGVLRNLWEDGANIDQVATRSNWLLELVDIRGWAHCLDPGNADDLVRIRWRSHILLFLIPPLNVQPSTRSAYWYWVEEKILSSIQEQFPDTYNWIIEWHRENFIDRVKKIPNMPEVSTNLPLYRELIFKSAHCLFPPLIAKQLLNDPTIKQEYSVKLDGKIAFETIGVSVQRSDLFDAARAVLAGADCSEIMDTSGKECLSLNNASQDWPPRLVISSSEQRIILPDLSVLSDDPSIRIRSIDEATADVNLPENAQKFWRDILSVRPLDDDEVDMFYRDLANTPIQIEQSLLPDLAGGQGTVSSLVPNSLRYFERLVGVYDGSLTIRNYATEAGRTFLEQLVKWRPYEGFLFSLLLSSHSALTAEIIVDNLDDEELVKAYDFIEKHGDLLSRVGAIEVGMRILSEKPWVEPCLLRLIYSIRDDEVEGEHSEFNLFSALFVLVDGELARTRLLSGRPTFYRRMASLAQAALIHRQLLKCDFDHDQFIQWALAKGSEHYLMQSFADMRTDPRWNPNFVEALQMKADYFGRIMIAGRAFEESFGVGELRDTILGDGANSLSKLCEFPMPFLPGPLEGSDESPIDLPENLARVIEEQLDTDEVTASSFFALVNSAMIFKVTTGHAELAAKALRLARYRLSNLDSQSQLIMILNGLATVAAVSRNAALADELRILERHYRHDSQFGFSIEEAMWICLVSSAAHSDLSAWRDFAGKWLTELAFDEMNGRESTIFHSRLIALLHAVPELWRSCARADAALQASRFL